MIILKLIPLMKAFQTTYGLKKFGYIRDFSAQLAQFNYLLRGTGSEVGYSDIDSLVDGLQAVNLNSYGCDNFHGAPVEEKYCVCRAVRTGRRTSSGEEIVGLFLRNPKRRSYEGVTWTTSGNVKTEVAMVRRPHLGSIYFPSVDSLASFLGNVAERAIPEPWDIAGKTEGDKFPILKSYIGNIFERLRREAAEGKSGKIVYSQDGQHILFNTNLPDTFGNDIIIMADMRKKVNGEEYYENPSMFLSGLKGKRQYGFSDDANPVPATFFEDVNEVIFQSSWEIDTNYEQLSHIIQDNRDRFPKEYQGRDAQEVAGDLQKSISLARRMARRNFKYIAPMYRPQTNCIQLLMPIYLSGSYRKAPDFALVLTPDDGIYVPETILSIEMAYQDARLIAMPDESWLRPDTLLVGACAA